MLASHLVVQTGHRLTRQIFSGAYGERPLLVQAQKGTCNSVRPGGRNRGCAKQANDPTLSSSFVNCHRLSVRIQCDSARSMTQQLLHYLDICFSCRQQGRIHVPERMRSDVRCDSNLHCHGADHAWPETILCGRVIRDHQNACKTAFPQSRIRRRFRPVTERAENVARRPLPVEKLHHCRLITVPDDGALRCCPLKPVDVICRQDQVK
jgi:hypothetical protein